MYNYIVSAKGKRAMLSFTTSQPKEYFSTHGNVMGDLDAWLWHIHVRFLFFAVFSYSWVNLFNNGMVTN